MGSNNSHRHHEQHGTTVPGWLGHRFWLHLPHVFGQWYYPSSSLSLPYPVYITVSNGARVLVCFYSNMHLCLPSSNFVLKSVLRVPSLIQNLIFVHQFTRDNVVSTEFDPLVFSIKDLKTR
jgi:hypothetical protein